ncbi:MAG TPA: DPP IV N-terminal domain-containing protein, partial [Longimicrobiales bacterium]|nr:DPP IV N-terminal domain-containing protein [Longimicrobiales bacterium]
MVFGRDYNLYMMSGEDYRKILDRRRGKSGDEAREAEDSVDVTEVQLTEDGEEYYSYHSGGRGDTDDEREESMEQRKSVNLSWSKDSRRFALVRQDQREVGDLWVIHSTGNKRPQLETYKYDMPGEEDVTQNEIDVYDLQEREMVKVDDDPWKDQDMSVISDRQFFYPDSEEPRRALWIGDGSDELWFLRLSRNRHRAEVMVAAAATGEARSVILDSLNTYIETERPEFLSNGDILWWSERDGWGHLYRYGRDGTLKNRLTEGPWHVEGIEGVDEENGVVYFTASGREEGEDPYYQHLYRVNLDGTGLRLLDPGNFDHRVSMGESNRFVVDNFSRVNTVPRSVLRNARGDSLLALEEADFSQLEAAGWKMPEPFEVKAADGVTDLYGVMYKPFDFDSTKV